MFESIDFTIWISVSSIWYHILYYFLLYYKCKDLVIRLFAPFTRLFTFLAYSIKLSIENFY